MPNDLRDIPKIMVDERTEASCTVRMDSSKTKPAPRIMERSSFHDLTAHDAKDFFVQLNELDSTGRFWKEKARWIKYEENVEQSGNWGRPFLPYIEAECLQSFKQSLHDGLVSLCSINDGAFNISHTIANMLVLGGYAEPRHRVRLQQIMALPHLHQGESTSRFRKKVQLSRETLRLSSRQRNEVMAHAWELTPDNIVRNRWVNFARKALDQERRKKGKSIVWENLLLENRCPLKDLLNQFDQNECHVGYLSAEHSPSIENVSSCGNTESSENNHFRRTKEQVKLRKIVHPESNGVVIFNAVVDFLKRDEYFAVFIRFQNEKAIPDFMEISIPIRFLYVLFTSKHAIHMDSHQICRVAATLFKNRTFARHALRAKTSDDLAQASNVFMDGSVLLPPGNWKPEVLIPVAGAISEISRKKQIMRKFKHREGKDLWRVLRAKLVVVSVMKGLVYQNGMQDRGNGEEKAKKISTAMSLPKRGDCPVKTRFRKISRNEESENETLTEGHSDSYVAISDDDDDERREIHPLHPNGAWFGGLQREFKVRYPQYWSDIKDGFHIQCFASLFYLAISLTAMCLMYGQVICKYTMGNLGPVEMLSSTSLSCILMAIFAAEPLSVIAGTAAMVIVEASTYQASLFVKMDFFQFRFITGMWIFLFLILILAFDKTHWIHYCTRFTEEILHVLVALLFMYEGIKNLVKVFEEHPLRREYHFKVINSSVNTAYEGSNEKPNTALLYTIFMFATFGIALGFRLFEKTRFFSPPIRRLLNFFSIPFAVNIMNVITYFLGVYLNTINIPHGFQPTSPNRDRLITPDFNGIFQGYFSYGIIPLAAIPALLTVTLLFIESEVTILGCYKQTRGRKGSGFHVNLLVVAIMVLISSFLGLPWMCLAAVETSVHLDSLKVWSSFDAPGVKSHVVKIREQRLTLFFTGILVGLAVFLNSYLNHIPEAVFSGMVLYMGVVALFGVQMIERFFLMFMAPGQHPNIPYLKNVPLHKVYLYTIIQSFCVMTLWIVKSLKIISPFFPLVVLLMIPLRGLLERFFTSQEISQLDNQDEEEGHGSLD